MLFQLILILLLFLVFMVIQSRKAEAHFELLKRYDARFVHINTILDMLQRKRSFEVQSLFYYICSPFFFERKNSFYDPGLYSKAKKYSIIALILLVSAVALVFVPA